LEVIFLYRNQIGDRNFSTKSELEIKFPYVLLAGGGRSKTTGGGLDNINLIGVGFSTESQLEIKSNWRSSPQAGEKPEAK